MINFLAEISKEFNSDILPTPCVEYSKQYDIYYLDINEYPTDTYWTQWGGTYDNYSNYNIELFYEQFLTRVYNEESLLNRPFSMMIVDRKVYFNVPKHTWLYPDYELSTRTVYPFLYSALNPDNPSYNIIDYNIAYVKLGLPSFNVKLSDNFAGVTLNQGFSISLINNDGFFDSEKEWKLFNTPVNIKKSTQEISKYEDFKNIRSGLIDNTTTNFDSFQISVIDKMRAMEKPVCQLISQSDYGEITIFDDAKNKSLPILYGTRTIELNINIASFNDTTRPNWKVFALPEGTNTVLEVYDENMNKLSYLDYECFCINNPNYIFNSITSKERFILYTEKGKYAKVIGYGNYDLNNYIYISGQYYHSINTGEIIKHLLVNKGDLNYFDDFWNISEVDRYIELENRNISLLITGGTVNQAINQVLENDMVYLIQQNDGRLTIRYYGGEYNTHKISSSMITKKPEKDFSKAQENYFSSCIVEYRNGSPDYSGFYTQKYHFIDNENSSLKLYSKKVMKEFKTELTSEQSAKDFSERLSSRYSTLKSRIKIPLGIDTSDMELLDTVEIDLNINDRVFSEANQFYIVELNPAQDILVLEEI